MRIAIYNRWLHTRGGGEQYTLTLATVLAQRHDVTLVTHQPVDLQALGAYLNLDLGALKLEVVPDSPTNRHVAALSARFDGFVGASHTDIVPARARQNALVVFFPVALPPAATAPVVLQGWYPAEYRPQGTFCWSEAAATIQLEPQAYDRRAMFCLAAPVSRTTITITCAGRQQVHTIALAPEWVAVTVPANATQISLASPPFQAPNDPRELGVMLWWLRIGKAHWWSRARSILDLDAHKLVRQPSLQAEALDHYRMLLAISGYTARWIDQRWGRGSEILYPPVDPSPPQAKQPLILSVGRFFPGGHAKQHRVLIDAFKQLHHEGLTDWRLELVGGLDTAEASHRAYFNELEALIGDAPITLSPNLPATELRRLYGEASLYWHASGYGIDAEHEPERAEHFGITVVEAMGAGAVPLVYGAGGPAKIVRDGQDGQHWNTAEELREVTRALVSDSSRCTLLGQAAQRRAEAFSQAAFERRVWEVFGEWKK